MADWLYDGPSVALSAWPTWVWVRPRDNRRILNCLANSLISSRLMPSTVVLSVELLTVSAITEMWPDLSSHTDLLDNQDKYIHLSTNINNLQKIFIGLCMYYSCFYSNWNFLKVCCCARKLNVPFSIYILIQMSYRSKLILFSSKCLFRNHRKKLIVLMYSQQYWQTISGTVLFKNNSSTLSQV